MQREGWQPVDRRYDDVGQSSETLDRPALSRLVEDIKEGKIDRVLVHRLDRIARKILYACQFLEILRQHDVAITIVSQPELTGDANGRLLINLMASFAEFEQEMTKSSHGRTFPLATGNSVLVEAAPRDQIWGIGLGQDNPKAQDPRQWRGQNLLGFAMMDVREKLRKS